MSSMNILIFEFSSKRSILLRLSFHWFSSRITKSSFQARNY